MSKRDGRPVPVPPVDDPEVLKAEIVRLEAEVSALRRTEAELSRAKETAEGASRAKSAFLANMSHELRTPLAAILGYAEMLRDEAEGAGAARTLADAGRIHEAGTNLLVVIDGVLELSRLEAGRTELLVETFPLRPLAEDCVAAARASARNGNEVRLEETGDTGTVHNDAGKVRRVLDELLDNAAKFTKGGTITVSLRREGESVVLSVADTGIGIAPELLPDLFSPFVQADASASRRYEGTGLGLALIERLCRLMGGSLSVVSELGKGSTFTARLPVEFRGAATDVEPGTEGVLPMRAVVAPDVLLHSTAPRPTKDRLILVVDDDPNVRDLMVRNLGRLGFPVVTAWGGEEGLRLARVLRPSAVILDVLMPRVTGWEVLAALRADPELAPIPVVMTTVLDEPAKSFALGAAAFVRKPVDYDRLEATLGELLGG